MSRNDQSEPSSLKIYFRLLGYVKPYIGFFILSIVGFVIFASSQPMLGYVLKYFVDGLSNPEASFFASVLATFSTVPGALQRIWPVSFW